MVNNRVFAFWFRLAASVLCSISLLFGLGIFDGTFEFVSLMYYTMVSNIIVVVWFWVLTVMTFKDLRKNGKDGAACYYPRISAYVMLYIVVTLLIYWTMLAPLYTVSDLLTVGNLGVHLVAPLLMIADYIIFSKRGHLMWRDSFLLIIMPIAYAVVITFAGFFLDVTYSYKENGVEMFRRFPYPFLDFDKMGAMVLVVVFALVVFFIGLTCLMVFVDKKLAKRNKDNRPIDSKVSADSGSR